jgi:UDPglucose 6-dehydrogenase
MNITIIGTGYVGLVTAACLAEQGNSVLCLDIDSARIASLDARILPIYEPGLKDLFERNIADGRLRFTDNVEQAVTHGDIQFIAVGTPSGENGEADLQYVLKAAANIGTFMDGAKIVVDKSTVPVGTGENVEAAIRAELRARNLESLDVQVLSNPEFLKEGAAVADFMRPDRIVIGIDGNEAAAENARASMRALYAPFNRNHDRILFMDRRSAEFTKYAANAMLATRISFMNELANLADRVGVDIEMVRQGIGSDTRIGYSFLYAGTGYGGSCFPKDVRALRRTAAENGQNLEILQAVERVNDKQKLVLVDKIKRRFGDDLSGMTFAVWGLAFKPETDDMREAPSRVIIRALLEAGAAIRAFDPVAMREATEHLSKDLADLPGAIKNVHFCSSSMDAAFNADALVIATEWKAFRGPDFAALKAQMNNALIFDGRNLYEPNRMQKLGFEYHAVGRDIIAASHR